MHAEGIIEEKTVGVAGTSCSAWNSQKHTGPGVRAEALTIPELEHSKAAVLNTLASVHSRRSYTFAINSLIAWYVIGDNVIDIIPFGMGGLLQLLSVRWQIASALKKCMSFAHSCLWSGF